jgi:hypothetical protein
MLQLQPSLSDAASAWVSPEVDEASAVDEFPSVAVPPAPPLEPVLSDAVAAVVAALALLVVESVLVWLVVVPAVVLAGPPPAPPGAPSSPESSSIGLYGFGPSSGLQARPAPGGQYSGISSALNSKQ